MHSGVSSGTDDRSHFITVLLGRFLKGQRFTTYVIIRGYPVVPSLGVTIVNFIIHAVNMILPVFNGRTRPIPLFVKKLKYTMYWGYERTVLLNFHG